MSVSIYVERTPVKVAGKYCQVGIPIDFTDTALHAAVCRSKIRNLCREKKTTPVILASTVGQEGFIIIVYRRGSCLGRSLPLSILLNPNYTLYLAKEIKREQRKLPYYLLNP